MDAFSWHGLTTLIERPPSDCVSLSLPTRPADPEARRERSRVFQPLYRGEASRNRRTGGSGLGLTIARRALRLHGGDITVANRPTGGAAFTCHLPRRPPGPAPGYDPSMTAISDPALGNNAHLFVRPYRRKELERCFTALVGADAVTSVPHPAMPEPMLLVAFPGGGHLSIEFVEDAPDEETPGHGAWLEIRAADPAGMHRAALDAGMPPVDHPGHPYYFMIPGGQVFTIAPLG